MPVAAFVPAEVITDGVDVDKTPLRAAMAEINTRLGEAPPTGYASYDTGEPMVLTDTGFGPAPASDGTVPVKFGRRAIGAFRPDPVDIDGTTAVTDKLHVGRLLRKKTSAAAVLSLESHPDPTVGVLDGFACTLLRYGSAGALQITSSMTNQHPSGHTRVQAGGMATLYVDTVENAWFLKGETEA
jgi:hypothetical protein